MRTVQQAVEKPHRCAVLPFVGNSNSSGWIDTGNYLDREKVYVSFEGVAEMARLIGWVPPSRLRVMEQEVASLTARLEQAEAELKEADRYRESVDYLSNHGQLKPYKKAGRPPKEPV